MSYRQVTMYVAVCNGCCDNEYEHDEYDAWSTKAAADEYAEGDGWTASRGRHLCARCVDGVIADPVARRIESAHGEPGPGEPGPGDQALDIGGLNDTGDTPQHAPAGPLCLPDPTERT